MKVLSTRADYVSMYKTKFSYILACFFFLLFTQTISSESVLLRTTEGEDAVEEAFFASLFDEGHIVTSERIEKKDKNESLRGFVYVLYVFSKEADGEYSVNWKLFKNDKEKKAGSFSARNDGDKDTDYLLVGAKNAVKTLFD